MAKKKNTTVKPAAPALPKGYKAIEHIGKFWSGQRAGDVFEGVLLRKKIQKFPKGKYPARDAFVYTFKTKSGAEIEITQSGGLGALEHVKKGQHVYIQFIGVKKLPGKRSMKEYFVAVR